MPLDLKEALAQNKKAFINFSNFSPSTQLMYVYWVETAKREETRIKKDKKSNRKVRAK